jgi:hypothetical protein
VRSPEMKQYSKPRFDASVQCSSCEHLLRRVNQARLHTLLAEAWSKLREESVRAQAQFQSAATELEGAFKELEEHWRESHGMKC